MNYIGIHPPPDPFRWEHDWRATVSEEKNRDEVVQR